MKKSSTLIVGIGQCFNILTNIMKLRDQRFTTLFVNSSNGDLSGLKFANQENSFIYSGGDGAGRNRQQAKTYIQNDSARLFDTLKNSYGQFEQMLIFFSTDGGTGSGSIKGFVSMVRGAFPKMIINLIGVIPKIEEDNKNLNNSLDCISDLIDISDSFNDIKFIDNNKGQSYEDINNRAIEDINSLFEMIGHDEIGSIDENNLKNIGKSKGYGVILNLPSNYTNYEEAIEVSKENSIFAIPDDLYCTYGGVMAKKNEYNVINLASKFDCDETIYKTYGDKNIIALGGCDIPREIISDIQDELKERKLRRPKSRRIRGLKSINLDRENIESNENIKEEKSKEIDYSVFDMNQFKF